MGNIFPTLPLEVNPIGTAETPMNHLDVNTIPGVVGEIWISTTSSPTTDTSSMSASYVMSVSFPETKTTTSNFSSSSYHLREPMFILIFGFCI